MSTRRKSARASLTLSLGEGVIYGCSFVRNMVLARLLTKADFGIAAALAMIVMLFEFSSKMGISRFLVRDKDGDTPAFVGAAHWMQMNIGILSASLILLGAWPVSRLFGIGEHAGALMLLAAIPVLHGLSHLDMKRFERNLRFGPSMLVEMIPQVAITLLAWPAAKWFGDFRAVLFLLITKSVCSLAGSHLVAERPYRLTWNREFILRMLRFGWPLLITGFLMFGVLQGEQFLVATFYVMSELGPYAAAAALTMAPTFFFGRVFNSLALSLLAKVQDDPAAFARRYRIVIAVVCAFSAACATGLILGAEGIMRLVYGEKYAGAGIILGWLAAANAFRNVRIAPTIAAVAKGDSVNQMVSNIARVTSLLPAAVVAMHGMPIWVIACTGLMGEGLACLVAIWRLRRVHSVPVSLTVAPLMHVVAGVAAAGGLLVLLDLREHAFRGFWAGAAGSLVAGAVVLLSMEASRQEIIRLAAKIKVQGLRRALLGEKSPGVPKPEIST